MEKPLWFSAWGLSTSFFPWGFAFREQYQLCSRQWFPLSNRDAPHLCRVLVNSATWQVGFLCTDSSQAAERRGECDRPRDKPAEAKCRAHINEAAQATRCLSLLRLKDCFEKSRVSFERLWAALIVVWVARILYCSPCIAIVKLRMLGESPEVQTHTWIAGNEFSYWGFWDF